MEDLERLVRSCVKAIEKVKAVTTDMRKILSTELDSPAKKSQINKIVSAALERARHNSQPQITMITNLDDSLDALYPFRTLVPLFVNIVENAVESIGGEGTITVKTRKDEGRAVITITDTGCGIAEERQGRIFEPFYTTKKERMGLGLSICRDILEEFKGTISVESKVNQGTTIRLELPSSS
jgi:signal transduction histidine kinase